MVAAEAVILAPSRPKLNLAASAKFGAATHVDITPHTRLSMENGLVIVNNGGGERLPTPLPPPLLLLIHHQRIPYFDTFHRGISFGYSHGGCVHNFGGESVLLIRS